MTTATQSNSDADGPADALWTHHPHATLLLLLLMAAAGAHVTGSSVAAKTGLATLTGPNLMPLQHWRWLQQQWRQGTRMHTWQPGGPAAATAG
jgi:hypothetical protein